MTRAMRYILNTAGTVENNGLKKGVPSSEWAERYSDEFYIMYYGKMQMIMKHQRDVSSDKIVKSKTKGGV